MKSMIALMALLFTVAAGAADEAPADRWQPVRFMLGSWQGEASGEPGKGTVERSYEFVLGGKFIEEHNTSSYAATAPDRTPEIHHHRGFLSYDKARKTLMLRHFHEEGFVNLYALEPSSPATRLVFESVSFENFSNEWKARETYELISPDEFIETFELAEPGKDFALYSRNHFTRKK
ncbi:MAG TPA: heme-binding beta-barrel domain-containing protein [Steroidobacteraceae bacterium]|nr:heme-binding beta-barrel domain-containing protein [Steroidobacteraceae bacterium]